MNTPMEFNDILNYLRSGSTFTPADSIGAAPHAEEKRHLRDAVQSGLARHYGEWLFPDFHPEWFVAEATASPQYNGNGKQLNPGRWSGGVKILRNRERGRFARSGRIASPFCSESLLLPSRTNSVELRASDLRGMLEVCFHWEVAPAQISWAAEQQELDFLLYCDADSSAAREAFRILSLAEWRQRKTLVFPTIGVTPSVTAPETWMSPLCRILAQWQPPMMERFLRIPVRAVLQEQEPIVCFQVRVGEEAGFLLEELGGHLRMNCIPFWNAALSVVEWAQPGEAVRIDVSALGNAATSVTVLNCLDYQHGQSWMDERFADGSRFTFRLHRESYRNPVTRMQFDHPPTDADWRILYLAGLGSLPNLLPGEDWLFVENDAFVVTHSSSPGPEAHSMILNHFPLGRVQTRAELVELLWRIMPAPLRRVIDLETLHSQGKRAFNIQCVMRPRSDSSRLAEPVTIVTFPTRTSARNDAAHYWLKQTALRAEQFLNAGEVLELRLSSAPDQEERP